MEKIDLKGKTELRQRRPRKQSRRPLETGPQAPNIGPQAPQTGPQAQNIEPDGSPTAGSERFIFYGSKAKQN